MSSGPGRVPRVVDSETSEFVMPGWMATDNRVSTITELVHLEVVYNERTERTYLVLGMATWPKLVPNHLTPGVRVDPWGRCPDVD